MKYTLSVPLFFLFACGEVIDTSTDDTKEGDILSDEDNDGFLSNEDCNDQDPLVYEGAEEICDGLDNNCDGQADEGVLITYYADSDGDGFGNSNITTQACEVPINFSTNGNDCDDTHSTVYPNATEVCDELDNDCDAEVDEDLGQEYYVDQDNDGYGDSETIQKACDLQTGLSSLSGDCDDQNPAISPGMNEFCDEIDNDCDGNIDNGVSNFYYVDTDEDGYGDPESSIESCSAPAGYVDNNNDCNDLDTLVHPNSVEFCDTIDNNCNGVIDENSSVDAQTWYADNDNDNFGSATNTTQSCTIPDGYIANSEDCDDADNDIYPTADELCNGFDDNCDNVIDGDDATDGSIFFADFDGDGFGNPSMTKSACSVPENYAEDDTDCNDANEDISPNANELCNGFDDNCDNVIDEDTAIDALVFYIDADDDGFGVENQTTTACLLPEGYATDIGDCDDQNTEIHPAQDEFCDEIDNNCNGIVDELDSDDIYAFYQDLDEDGFGDIEHQILACAPPSGFVSNFTDCDDTEALSNPDMTETCDDIDNDCDGTIDNGVTTTYYADSDEDGYGWLDTILEACDQPLGYVTDSTDCDDNQNLSYPNNTETCDNIDNDCNGETDDNPTDGTLYYKDSDEDTFGDANKTINACNQPDGYVVNSTDCDDNNNTTNPEATEFCNGINDDCDENIDEDAIDALSVHPDIDEDGYGDQNIEISMCTIEAGYTLDNSDCNDTLENGSTINPDQIEVCDELDNNCNGLIDEQGGDEVSVWYLDNDGDGFGDIQHPLAACNNPEGYVDNATDCDDSNTGEAINPNATEVCDGIDNNCDTFVDDGSATDAIVWYRDADNDGFGNPNDTTLSCLEPIGYLSDMSDCDDNNNTINPDATEICNNVDDDCQNGIDIDAADMLTFYEDIDGDGFGSDVEVLSCTLISGVALLSGDCDDESILFSPTAQEICDGLSNDCDEEIDESAVDLTTWYFDQDNDGHGTNNDTITDCAQPDGYVSSGNDCDDENNLRHPNAEQTCTGIDDNCDGNLDENEVPSGQSDSCSFDGTCLDLQDLGMGSGTYTISVGGTPVQTYCDQDTDGGGWTLVWKHAYYEVGTPTDHMRFYASTFVQDCPTFGDSDWCNIPQKTSIGQSEMRVQATHNGTTVYDYKGDMNANLDTNWSGGIMENWSVLEDQCNNANSSARPEPENSGGGHVMEGLTWDKANNGNYTGNCDSDRYGNNGSDCRWENCGLPSSISSTGASTHVQMTLQMWLR